MINDLYNKLVMDKEILKIYNDIGILEDQEKGWAYHNFDHIMNVTNIAESLLKSLNYDNEFITKAKIACLFHDVGALEGKKDHAYRSYLFTKKYFEEKNINFDGTDLVLEAIKIHSDGFESDNVIALVLILSDKLDVKKTRIAKEGFNVVGNRQYSHVDDILINIDNNCLIVNFITDHNIDMNEVSEYYFTKKIFKAIESFSNKLNLKYKILMDNKEWNI